MAVVDNEINWRAVFQPSSVRGIWPAPDSERVAASEFQNGIGLKIVYTVPANKLLFIATAILVTLSQGAADVTAVFRVRDDLDVEKYRLIYQYYTNPGSVTAPVKFMPALEAAAGWDVYIENEHAGLVTRGFVFGWLEDA